MNAKISTIAIRASHQKGLLEAKLQELLGLSLDRRGLEAEVLADPLDQVRLDVDRDMVVQQVNQQSRMIEEIRSALDKMRDQAYGICEECDQSIAQQRLDAIPWARLCVKCQSQSEARTSEAMTLGHAA
jgi:DnaK suppressor protein